MATLAEMLSQGWGNIKSGFNAIKGQAPQDMTAPNIGGDVWQAPANFASPGYQRDDFGNFYRVGADGVATQFTPTQTQLQDLTKAGMPMDTQSASVDAANAAPVLKPNVVGDEKNVMITNAIASALAAGQANKPKLTQAAASSSGSVLQPKNTLLDLLAQTSVRRNK